MDELQKILACLVALGMATERVTETIKNFPGLAAYLAKGPAEGGKCSDEARGTAVRLIAISVGIGFGFLAADYLSSLVHMEKSLVPFLIGPLASGGSGIWNSTLDVVREINKQKGMITKQMEAASSQGK